MTAARPAGQGNLYMPDFSVIGGATENRVNLGRAVLNNSDKRDLRAARHDLRAVGRDPESGRSAGARSTFQSLARSRPAGGPGESGARPDGFRLRAGSSSTGFRHRQRPAAAVGRRRGLAQRPGHAAACSLRPVRPGRPYSSPRFAERRGYAVRGRAPTARPS